MLFAYRSDKIIQLTAIAITLAATTSIAQVAQAGTIRHDVDDSYYRNEANFFPSVGYFGAENSSTSWGCSGTLIAPSYMLTATHCVTDDNNQFLTSGTFWVGGNPYFVTAGAYNSAFSYQNIFAGNDIAVVQLANSVFNVDSAALYFDTNEDLQAGTYVGFGATGNGITGFDFNTAGTKRAGQNIIGVGSRLANYGVGDNLLVSDFDDPRMANDDPLTQPLFLEYQLAPGDSGGGLFIDGKVAGIHSFITSLFDNSHDASYGDFSASTRVSSFTSWINDAINALENLGISSSSSTNNSGTSTGSEFGTKAPLAPEYNLFDRSFAVRWIDDKSFRGEAKHVPEPSSIFGLLFLGALTLKTKHKQQVIRVD